MKKLAECKVVRDLIAFDKELTEYKARVRDDRRKDKVRRVRHQLREVIDERLDILASS